MGWTTRDYAKQGQIGDPMPLSLSTEGEDLRHRWRADDTRRSYQTSSESGRKFLGYDGGMVKGAEEESNQTKSYLKNLHAESVCDETENKLNNLL